MALASFASLALANCCCSQRLPPELLALVQLPVLRWSSGPVMCRVTVTLPVAARSALPPRLSAAPGLYRLPNTARFPNTALVAQRVWLPAWPCLFWGLPVTGFPYSGLAFSCDLSVSTLKVCCDFLSISRSFNPDLAVLLNPACLWPSRRDPRAEGVLLSGRW